MGKDRLCSYALKEVARGIATEVSGAGCSPGAISGARHDDMSRWTGTCSSPSGGPEYDVHVHTHTLTSVKKSQRRQDRKRHPGETKEVRLLVVFFFPVSWAPTLGEMGLVSPSKRTCGEKVAQEALRPLKAEQRQADGGGQGDQNWKHRPGGEPQVFPRGPGWTPLRQKSARGCDKDRGPRSPLALAQRGGGGMGRVALLAGLGPLAVPPVAGLQSRQRGSQAPF